MLTLLALTDSCQARAAHNRQSVFPVPVGLSSKAFFPCSVLLNEVQQDHSPTMIVGGILSLHAQSGVSICTSTFCLTKVGLMVPLEGPRGLSPCSPAAQRIVIQGV